MGFGALIIGDEIISGKREDKHMARVIEVLTARGLDLAWAQYLGDDPALITDTLRRTLATSDVVFSFGGIGATPDDYTRQCAADAMGVPVERHPEGVALLEAKFGEAAWPKRVLMVEFPRGSNIVPNPYNGIPGFSVGNHYFLPGFPEMAWPMMEWALDTHYAHLQRSARRLERSITVHGAFESQLMELMNDVVARFPLTKLFSLPTIVPDGGRRIELGVKGDPQQVQRAIAHIKASVSAMGFEWQDATPPS